MTAAADSAAATLTAKIKAARSLSLRFTDVQVHQLEALLEERTQLLAAHSHDTPASELVQAIVEDLQQRGIPIYRQRAAPDTCSCPWPWGTEAGHILRACPHYEDDQR